MDTIFEPVRTKEHLGGEQKLYRFDNGYGASVIRNQYSHGGSDGLWELGVIAWDGDKWELTYDTPITGNVIGHLSDAHVEETLAKIKALDGAR